MKTKLALAAILTASLLFTAHAQEPKTEVKMTEIPYITLSAELFEKGLPLRDGKYITIAPGYFSACSVTWFLGAMIAQNGSDGPLIISLNTPYTVPAHNQRITLL